MNKYVNKVIDALIKLRDHHPDRIIVIETPTGVVDLRIGDAMIYLDPDGRIVIDTE